MQDGFRLAMQLDGRAPIQDLLSHAPSLKHVPTFVRQCQIEAESERVSYPGRERRSSLDLSEIQALSLSDSVRHLSMHMEKRTQSSLDRPAAEGYRPPGRPHPYSRRVLRIAKK